jgi:hypothetical protein
MKVKKYLFWLMMVLAVAVVACEEEDDGDTCDSDDLTADFNCPPEIDVLASFCADGVNPSYYTYNGTDYYCTGVDASTCDVALNQIGVALLDEGCSSKKKSMEASLINLSTMAENLLEEVRTESVCN